MSRKLSPQQQRLIAVLLLCLLSRSDLLVRRCDAVAVAVSAVNAAPTEEDSQPSSLPYVRGGDNLVGGGWLNIEGPLRGVKKRYDGLTPKGKFIAMTAVGFIGSRLVMDVATTAIKWAGAAFIVYEHSLKEERTEVLHHAGVLDDLPSLSAEQRNFVQNVQTNLRKTAEGFRSEVRRRLHPGAVQGWIDRDKMGALGLAAGSFAGIVL